MPKKAVIRKSELAKSCSKILNDAVFAAGGRTWTELLRHELRGEFTDAEIDWAVANIRPALAVQRILSEEL